MKPQKALHLYQQLEKKNPNLEGKEFMIFEKYDGWYGYWDVGGPIMSRQMRAIPSLKWLSEKLNESANSLPNGRLIFEILVKGVPVFKDLNGILNRKEPAKDAYLIIHDFIPLHKIGYPAEARLSRAKSVLRQLGPCLPVQLAQPLAHCVTYDYELWQSVARKVWAKGGEGIIIKSYSAPYSPGKRNADILKIKLEHSEEMVVTGGERGRGKYSQTLGYLIVLDKHGVHHKVSGMTDEERDSWWNDFDLIVGKVVEVQFMQRLANGSLREPRFKAVRHDKTREELG